MVKLIAFREDYWFAPIAEEGLYSHIAQAYGCESQMIREWSDAVLPPGHPVVMVHHTGTVESKDFAHPQDAVYVFGRTGLHLDLVVPTPTYVVKVGTRGMWSDSFGATIAAIILRDRQYQGLHDA